MREATDQLDRALAKAEDFCRQQVAESEERLARWAREDGEHGLTKREVDALGRV